MSPAAISRTPRPQPPHSPRTAGSRPATWASWTETAGSTSKAVRPQRLSDPAARTSTPRKSRASSTSRKGRLTALVHFDSEKLKAFLESTDELKRTTQEKLENLKKEVLEYVNQKVSKFSRISEIDPQEEEFEKTATHKIKRYLYDGSRAGEQQKKKESTSAGKGRD